MKHIAILAVMASLTACGGELNPAGTLSGSSSGDEDTDTNANGIGAPRDDDGGSGGGDVDPTPPENGAIRYLFDEGDQLVANLLEFDSATNELIVNNIPFDSADQRYVATGVTLNGAQLYRSKQTATTGRTLYYALRAGSESGESQAIIVATNGYRDTGYAGASAQRLNGGSVTLPTEGQYNYLGDYSAIQVVRTDDDEDRAINSITGDIQLDVDIEDFDVSGAVEAFVINREVFDLDGNSIGTDERAIILPTAEIDFETGSISSDEVVFNEGGESGRFEAVFAGDDGGEITGVIELGDLDSTRELGVFTSTRQPGR